MDTIVLRREAYTRVAGGMKRIDLEDEGVKVKAYQVDEMIRIDINEKQTPEQS